MSHTRSKTLGVLLLCIFVLVGLVALPTVLRVHRSLPLEGEVTEVTDFQSQQRDSDGDSVTEFSSNHWIRFKNPRSGAIETQVLHDIYRDKGQSVRILYDPNEGTIEFDSFARLFKTPLWLFGLLILLWLGLQWIAQSL